MSTVILLALLLVVPVGFAAAPDAGALYRTHCASCHGEGRLGGMGPALLPDNLVRLRPSEAARVIAKGRAATQMPAFGEVLNKAEIAALVELIYAPPAVTPEWGTAEIEASHRVLHPPGSLPDEPVFDTPDRLNLFVVVERGDHHVTLLDGTTFEPIHRFPTRADLHGGPKFSPDGRYVHFASRDGWISRYDLYNLETVAEVRAGINTRNAAVSADGRFVMVANYLPHTLVVLDARDLSLLKVIPVVDDHGRSSRVSAVYAAPPRRSFIAALKDLEEVWEIPYAEDAPALPVYRGIVHDYRPESGEPPPIDAGPFPVRRIKLDDYLDDFFFDPDYEHLIGASRDGGQGQVVNLIVGRTIAEIPLPGLPHLGSGITWMHQGRPVVATPNLREGVVSVIDLRDWSVVERIETLGPGFFLRSHENTSYAWVDVFFGPDHDALHVIDKQTLSIVETLRPAPGKTAAHVEFTRDGRYALVSIWDDDGALVIYDARSLEEVKRIPMRKPSGKYNIYNKINLSSGTSH
ncbi:MAG: cytochrome D1 domain-containing protein [Candidatus Competibacterales bacterium]|nr:cytochrome D1 domain-containing protein [Candidatus Competibacterales bacterium]